MSTEEKLQEAMLRAIALLPRESAEALERFLTPTNLAVVVGTLAAWAAAHLSVVVGLVADAVLLVVGVVSLGLVTFQVIHALSRFCTAAAQARTEPQLDEAATHFADAVLLAGVGVVEAVLTKKAISHTRSGWTAQRRAKRPGPASGRGVDSGGHPL